MHLLAGTISGSPSPSGFLLGALQFPFLCLKLESTELIFVYGLRTQGKM